jgi:hypothetical protein
VRYVDRLKRTGFGVHTGCFRHFLDTGWDEQLLA